MSRQWPSATFTTEFGHEFEAERYRWLRRRFLWYTGVVGGFGALVLVATLVAVALLPEGAGRDARFDAWVDLGVLAVTAALYLGAFVHVRLRPGARDQPLRLAYWLIVTNGVLRLVALPVASHVALWIDPNASVPLGVDVFGALSGIFTTHLFACLFLPWTPRESVRPLVPLVSLHALAVLVFVDGWYAKLLAIAVAPAIALPGAAICWWRHSRHRERFTLRMLRGRYHELRRELVDARRIHEALFPAPCREGPLRFDYRYEPMRQIGGDYLYCHNAPARPDGPGPMSVVLIDVTGHGIPAALTVNRLHGELERIFAEDKDVRPGEVLRLLNRYVHLTLATHSVYVTALCLRIDPVRQELEYASGGHPPAFLRAVDGTIDQLDSTAFVLGACAGEDFDPEPRTLRFGPGDTLVAYTDGATEARDADGRMLGIDGLRRLIAGGRASPDDGWPLTILRAVEHHRKGPPADDTLVIELRMVAPIAGAGPTRPPATGAAVAQAAGVGGAEDR